MPEAPRDSHIEHDLAEKNREILNFIEDVTANADEVQKRVLSEILSRNANVEYLRRHGLNGQTDRDTFKNLLPVITYEDVQPDINRIANGDTSPILTSKPITEFLTRCPSFSTPQSLLLCFSFHHRPSHGNIISFNYIYIYKKEIELPITEVEVNFLDFTEKFFC